MALLWLWATGDPTRYARRRRPARILMLNGHYDLCVPRRFTLELWRALGGPPVRWLSAGHITGLFFRETIVCEVLAALGLLPPAKAPLRRRLRSRAQREAAAREVGWAA